MPRIKDIYSPPHELVLGKRLNSRLPEADQKRQREEVEEILRRLRHQPGVILADEVGMGKTFVALAIAYSVAIRNPRGPVIIMVPANLVEKWEQDLKTFCELYVENRHPVQRDLAKRKDLTDPSALRYGVARHSVELMRMLDDSRTTRCQLIFLSQGAMSRRQSDKWIRLALIANALRRYGRGRANRLIQVRKQIHRFLAELIFAIGEEHAHGLGDELWESLLREHPREWKNIYNESLRDERRRLMDDPVPKSVIQVLKRIDLSPIAEALKKMPIHARGGDSRVSERLKVARNALRDVERTLWKNLLRKARWRSPLLVMDEAHHLKNPATSLARQLHSPDTEQDLRTGDGAMEKAFDRMLFLTATPFQLGHRELVYVLKRFGDVRWDEKALGSRENFQQKLLELSRHLDESQRTAIGFQRNWSRLRPEDCDTDIERWWGQILLTDRELLASHQQAIIDSFNLARRGRNLAESTLRPWIVRHNKGTHWNGTDIISRKRLNGGAIAGDEASNGLPIPPQNMLPFFLAARSVVNPEHDLLGEALCSSYEAFRFTRGNRDAEKDDLDEIQQATLDLSHSDWYLSEFDLALERYSGSNHPKVDATVRKVVDLWEAGEKVLVFAFYRQTCRALRIHISREIERRVMVHGQRLLTTANHKGGYKEVDRLVKRIQDRYFDVPGSPGRRAIDAGLAEIMSERGRSIEKAQMNLEQKEILSDVMRRFLRVATTLIRCFPISELDSISPAKAVAKTLDYTDGSGISWRRKFDDFIEFLTDRCSSEERRLFLEAARRTETGGIRVEDGEEEDSESQSGQVTLANVQVAMGTTRRDTRARLMRAFNTPFFPDILVCSKVMGEGVDLQRFCRHVIHHDLDWNPSSIEQRTGRIDRLGCKAEGRHPIVVYLPYLSGTADERQYQVMSDREMWFRVVMGQDEVAKLITADSTKEFPLPCTVSEELSFKLGLSPSIP
jgi:ERCC4-related helicase/predicted nucleic acid-binding protein